MSETAERRSYLGVPPGWALYRMRQICEINPSKTETSGLDPSLEVSFLPMEKLGENGILTLDVTKQLGEVRQGFTYFRDCDVVFAKITPSFENGKVAICRNLQNGIGFGTTELHVLRPRRILCEPSYIFYVVSSSGFRQLGIASMQGVAGQQRVTEQFLANFPVLLPSLPEQRAIADFLDRETAKIDALIARKQRLLELLAERRQALITHAVTKGLDPDAPMKDSGVEWLGEIPAHWEAIKLRYLTDYPLQYGSNALSESDDRNLPRYIRITDIDDDGSLRQDIFRSLPEDLAEPFILEEGDILFARSGATVGKTLLYEQRWGKACFAGYLIRMRPDTGKVLPEFIKYFTETANYWDWVRNSTIQATIQNVSAEKYSDLTVPIPGIQLQERIVEHLKSETNQIGLLSLKTSTVIDRLQERRTVLINDAVTGKIRVAE